MVVKKKKVKKPIKKVTKKIVLKVVKKEKPIGVITHYFSDIKVAVIKLKDNLKLGQRIRITGGENTDFEQEVKSIQVDHKPVKLAKKGKSIGIKVAKKSREGYRVFKAQN